MGRDLRPLGGADERRAFRAFVKANHPDAGGDPEAFLAGLSHWEQPSPSGRAPAEVVFHRSRRGLARLIPRWSPRPMRSRPPR